MMNEVFPQGYAWLDGNFAELSKAKISILDWGFLRSDATYDVVKARFEMESRYRQASAA